MTTDETNVKELIKKLKDECGGYHGFYMKIYGREPEDKHKVQMLTNYVNRSSYSLEFILTIIDRFELYNLTFDQFCNGELPKRRTKKRTPLHS